MGQNGSRADGTMSGEWIKTPPCSAAVTIWINELSNKTVLIRTDNDAVVANICKLYSRENYLNNLLNAMALTPMKNTVVLKCEHIPGEKNVLNYTCTVTIIKA